MRFSELPVEARRYILYHVLVSPALIVWYALPFYLIKIGYTVLEVGVFFTAAQLLSIPVTMWLGKIFSKTDIRKGFIIIESLDSVSTLIYGLAYGPILPLMIIVGEALGIASESLYFLYPAYERIIYPEDRMEEALAWHLRLPEIGIIVSYPILGFILGYICYSPECMRMFFIGVALYGIVIIAYIAKYVKPVIVTREEEPKRRQSLRRYWERYKYYVVAEVLFTIAWSLAPSLALVYYVVEWLHGNLFHVALLEASISTATLTGTWITDRLGSKRPFEYLSIGTLIASLGLAAMILSDIFYIALAAVYILRIGDAIVFVYKRSWLYRIMSREEASIVSAALSSIRRIIRISSPLLVGILATLDPRMPYIGCMVFLLLTIPIYILTSRNTGTQASFDGAR